MRLALALVLAFALLTAGCGSIGDSSDEGDDSMFIGALEDVVKDPNPAEADRRVALTGRAGFDALNVTTPWIPGQAEPDPGELILLENVANASKRDKIRLIISVFHYRSRDTPVSDQEQQEFARYVALLARKLPSVRDFAIGNEPNLNGFWMPQFDDQGRSASAPAYVSLLAATYDALKEVSPEINVIGGSLAPRGSDNPELPRDTQSPTTFIRDMGAAYKASGRDEPVMDIFAIHPYLERSEIPPSTPHPAGTAIGIADYDKLVELLGEAFDGTAQKGADVPIAYTEFGVQSEIPPSKLRLYQNVDSPIGVDAVDEQTQAQYYREAFELAACQETVVGFLVFHLMDEPDLARWQSGVYYVDHSPKSSLEPVAQAAKDARKGETDCGD